MTNEGGSVRYDPAEITIQAGDTVKWIIAGGSHNIVFWPDSVPQGAADLLRKAMPDTAGTLQSPRFPNPGDSYSVVFAGMPKGVYKYHCRPHLTRGMVAKITVAE
jgi:plastocyanin